LVGARGILEQNKKKREQEQQEAIQARGSQELTEFQKVVVFGAPAVAATALAGLFAVGPITEALKPAPPAKGGKKAEAKGPSLPKLELPKLGGIELPKSATKADAGDAPCARRCARRRRAGSPTAGARAAPTGSRSILRGRGGGRSGAGARARARRSGAARGRRGGHAPTAVAMSVLKIIDRVSFFSHVAASQTCAKGPDLARMLCE